MRHTVTRVGTLVALVLAGVAGVAAASPPSDDVGSTAAAVASPLPTPSAAPRRHAPRLVEPSPGPPAPRPLNPREHDRRDDRMPRAHPERPGPVRMPLGSPTPPPPVPMPSARGEGSGHCPDLPSAGPVVCDLSPGRPRH